VIDGGVSSAKDSLSLYTGASISTPLKALSLGVSYDYLASGSFNSSYANAYAGVCDLPADREAEGQPAW
jgi:hypothetical protein